MNEIMRLAIVRASREVAAMTEDEVRQLLFSILVDGYVEGETQDRALAEVEWTIPM